YGTSRVIEDFLRVDKRIFGMTGSQWTGLTVALISIAILVTWAVRARGRASPPGREEPEPAQT
ncbi:MAG TPA: hypothetical protein VGA18_04780, partial [Rhodothermales bacterium]